jgi:hypothetical protein
MTINPSDFRQFVISPALAQLAPAGIAVTKTAADLLMATAANETDLGTWLNQDPGPALGVFQIEPASLASLMAGLSGPELAALNGIMTPQPIADQLDTNLVLAAAICRLFYWKVLAPLPTDTVSGLWSYYKTYYNTYAGAATMDEFVSALKLTDLEGLPA